MPKTDKDVFFMLDDLEDSLCKLDLMIQGFISATRENTQDKRMEEQLKSTVFEIEEEIVKNKRDLDFKPVFNK